MNKYYRLSLPEREESRGLVQNQSYREIANHLQDYISIEERPAEVAERTIPGHWEGDFLMGPNNKSALGALVKRTTRLTLLVKIKNKDAVAVCETFGREFKHLPEALKRFLTYDQGQEMAEHKLFTKNTRIKVYFAHPHNGFLLRCKYFFHTWIIPPFSI